MAQIIYSVAAIALLAFVAASLTIYYNPEKVTASTQSRAISEGFITVRDAAFRYRREHGELPAGLSNITPSIILMPATPFPERSAAWTYVKSGEAVYICISGSVSKPIHEAVAIAKLRFSPQAFFVGLNCGITASTPVPDPGDTPGHIAATLWLTAPTTP